MSETRGKSQVQEEIAPEAPVFLLDNNAVQSILGKETAPLLEPLLKEIGDIGGVLAVSDIVLYEALKAIVFDEQKVRPVAEFIDTYLTRYLVDDNVLIAAARVHEIYGSEPATKKFRDKYSTEDIIIATTAMIIGAYIITSDCNDFPMPFFKEINRQTLYYEEGDRRRHIIIHVLQPDQEVITNAINKLSSTRAKKKATTKAA